MNRRNLMILAAASVLTMCAAAANAQMVASLDRKTAGGDTVTQPVETQLEASYDVQLQLLIGTNDATAPKGEVPANLANLAKQIRTSIPFSSYRLATTFLGRIASDGNFEYKATSNIFGQENDARMQTFLEWSLARLKNLPTAKGGQGFHADAFRFGAKVPVVLGTGPKDENGKPTPAVSYEPIGLNLTRIGIVENIPTLIGTLNLPGANGMLFLVITIKSVDM